MQQNYKYNIRFSKALKVTLKYTKHKIKEMFTFYVF